ncbi:MFS transporter [Cypionkella sp.]|uniref:MFS transporter n=1 Tax=Cypionkella sp. TaxID=2811411 RepID=UPI0026185920|nr:MFS transporter [Cypionkella sp.]MDB5664336.1 transporter [Cypionkella sp.]
MRAVLTVLALWAAGLGAAAQFGKISVLYQTLQTTYAAHAGVGIGLMVSIVGIVGLIFGTTAGLLVAKIGPRRAILSALAMGAAVSLIQSNFPSYPLMMLTRVLEGVSHLTIVVVGPTAIAGVTSARYQGLAMTLWSSFFGVTYAALAYFAPGLIALHGPGALFQMHGIWLLLCSAALFALMPRDPAHRRLQGQGNLLAQHVAIYASPYIAAPAMGFVCYTVAYVAILTLLPAVVTPGWGPFIGVFMPLVSITVSLTLGVWLLSKIPAFRLVQAGFAVAISASLGLWLTWGQGAYEAGFALLMAAALGVVQGASFASLAQINPTAEDRARGAGAIAQLGNLGTTIGTPLLALILAKAGATGFVVFLIGFSSLGIVIHAWQARRRVNFSR